VKGLACGGVLSGLGVGGGEVDFPFERLRLTTMRKVMSGCVSVEAVWTSGLAGRGVVLPGWQPFGLLRWAARLAPCSWRRARVAKAMTMRMRAAAGRARGPLPLAR
jgi:hypothetical protein